MYLQDASKQEVVVVGQQLVWYTQFHLCRLNNPRENHIRMILEYIDRYDIGIQFLNKLIQVLMLSTILRLSCLHNHFHRLWKYDIEINNDVSFGKIGNFSICTYRIAMFSKYICCCDIWIHLVDNGLRYYNWLHRCHLDNRWRRCTRHSLEHSHHSCMLLHSLNKLLVDDPELDYLNTKTNLIIIRKSTHYIYFMESLAVMGILSVLNLNRNKFL